MFVVCGSVARRSRSSAVSRDFLDTRLARNQHHPAFARLGPGPAPKQQFGFFFPPDEGSQAGRMHGLEAVD
jgi:hypothetical protein